MEDLSRQLFFWDLLSTLNAQQISVPLYKYHIFVYGGGWVGVVRTPLFFFLVSGSLFSFTGDEGENWLSVLKCTQCLSLKSRKRSAYNKIYLKR